DSLLPHPLAPGADAGGEARQGADRRLGRLSRRGPPRPGGQPPRTRGAAAGRAREPRRLSPGDRLGRLETRRRPPSLSLADAGSRKAVARLIASGAHDDALIAHYRGCVLPDESFVQTVLHNDPSLRVCNDDLRFARWQPASSHPDVLGLRDVDAVLASGTLFA